MPMTFSQAREITLRLGPQHAEYRVWQAYWLALINEAQVCDLNRYIARCAKEYWTRMELEEKALQK